jgi:transcriptional regulator with XRE-family HTH domain
LGERIRRIRTRHRKSQEEFADILGSQRNSISRYEKDKVEPGLAILSKLHALAEQDEKEAFAAEIRRQIGTRILGSDATVQASIEELRPMIEGMAEIQKLDALVEAGRKDAAGVLWAAQQLAEDRHIDKALTEILRLWVKHRKQKGAESVFQATAEYLRERLTQRFGEASELGRASKKP